MTDSGFDFFPKLKHFIATGDVLQGWSKQERWKVRRSAGSFLIKGNCSTFFFFLFLRLSFLHPLLPLLPCLCVCVCVNVTVDDRLFYIGPKRQYMRLVIENNEEKDKVLQECHFNPGTGNHNGVRGTKNKVVAGYYWFTLAEDVVNMVSSLLSFFVNLHV